MNSSSEMPISETLVALRARGRSRARRPDQRAGDDVAEGCAEPEPPEQRDEDQRDAEHHRAALAGCGVACAVDRLGVYPQASIAASSARNGSRIAPWRAVRVRAGASAAIPGQ